MTDPGRWTTGEPEIERMISDGELDEVVASESEAQALLGDADGHLLAAEAVADLHPPSAFSALYDAARKSMTAALAKQGLRATSKGGHRVVQDALEAQLGNAKSVVRPFRGLRRTRNDSQYPQADSIPVDATEVREGIDEARGIVDAMKLFLPQVGPWR